MDNVLMILNQNKVMWGVSMLLLNIGSRYVVADLGKSHEYILSNQIVKKLVVLSMFFVATRDILTSFLLTLSYILIVDGILHEKRAYCLLPKKVVHNVNVGGRSVSADDYQRAKSIVASYEQHKKNEQSDSEPHTIEKKKEYINYLTNIAILKSNR
jgi:hypothetical protein